jgi:hypothetical protein
MARFYYEATESQTGSYEIFDRRTGSDNRIAYVYDLSVAELICKALNETSQTTPITRTSAGS